MRIKPIASNMTELSLNDGTLVLFSYQTPVASFDRHGVSITNKKWSNTTTRHINKWLKLSGLSVYTSKDQSYFDNLVNQEA